MPPPSPSTHSFLAEQGKWCSRYTYLVSLDPASVLLCFPCDYTLWPGQHGLKCSLLNEVFLKIPELSVYNPWLWGSPLGISLCVSCVCPLSHHGISFVQNGDPSLWWLWGLKLWMFTRTLLFDVAMNGLWMLSKRFPGTAGKGARDDIRHSSEAETWVQSTTKREDDVRWLLHSED